MATLEVWYLRIIANEKMDLTILECSFDLDEAYEAHNKSKTTLKE